MKNPWGMHFQPGGPFWINDEGSGVATLYDGNGTKVNTFTIPNPINASLKSEPTGLVWNPTQDFLVPGTQLPAHFVMGTFEGSITAWAPNLPVAPTVAVTAVDNSKAGAVYTSIEIGETVNGPTLYAVNVHTGVIESYDSTFKPVELTAPSPIRRSPWLHAFHAPHNILGNIAVAYAKQNATKTLRYHRSGLGYVDLLQH